MWKLLSTQFIRSGCRKNISHKPLKSNISDRQEVLTVRKMHNLLIITSQIHNFGKLRIIVCVRELQQQQIRSILHAESQRDYLI